MSDHRLRPACERYEYRVWDPPERMAAMLADLSDAATCEHRVDRYLLAEDPSWNIKIRNDVLKVKHLEDERRGFQLWSTFPRSAVVAGTVREMLERHGFACVRRRGDAVMQADGDAGLRVELVTKHRRLYRIAGVCAEVSDLAVHDTGQVLRTIGIEGDDLRRLQALGQRIGLIGDANIPVHEMLRARRRDDHASSSASASSSFDIVERPSMSARLAAS